MWVFGIRSEFASHLLCNDGLTFRKLFLPFSFMHRTNSSLLLLPVSLPLIAFGYGYFLIPFCSLVRNCSADTHGRTDVVAHAHNRAGFQASSATTLGPLRCAPISKTQSNLIVQSAVLPGGMAAQCRRPLSTMRLDCFAQTGPPRG